MLLNLYSCAVVGPVKSGPIAQNLPVQALHMALATRQPIVALLHHSDRGSQYAAGPYQQLLTTHGTTASMSRARNCWDNACMESFFRPLKRRLMYHRQYTTRREATHNLFEDFEVFYTRQYRHSTLGYRSPTEFEARTAVV